MKHLRRLRTAVGFLSILPVGGSGWAASDELARGVGFFPAVGLLVGAGGVLIISLVDGSLGHNAANALVVLFLVVITGGLHIDGLADTADALPGPRTRERRLEIMRSGNSGPLGVAAVTLILLIKYSLLTGLLGPARFMAVLLAPALARWPIVILAWGLPSARKEGLGHTFAGQIKTVDVFMASIFVLALLGGAGFFWGSRYLLPAGVLVLSTYLAAAANRKMLGGVTGDTLGATVEISEALMLATFLAIQ